MPSPNNIIPLYRGAKSAPPRPVAPDFPRGLAPHDLRLVEPHKPDLYAGLQPKDEPARDWPILLYGAAAALVWIAVFLITRWASA